MIELIFVIVILGILAAVAIPKLTATRDDATVSKIAMNIATAASEISAYAISHEGLDDNLSKMSNAVTSLVDVGDATVASNEMNISLDGANCATLKIDKNATSGIDTLSISYITSNTSSMCVSLQDAIDASQYPMKLRGANVKY